MSLAKRAGYLLGGVALAAGLVVLIAPALIDTPAVRAEIQRRLAKALDGQVSWQALEVALLPAPRGELKELRVEIPGKLSLAAQEVRVYLRLWPLLFGSPEISSIAVRKPDIRVATAGGSEQAFDAVTVYRRVAQPVVQALREFAPDTELRVDDAAINVAGLHDLSIGARTGSQGVDVELTASSAFWKRLSVKGRIEYAGLAARAQVELDALVVDKEVPPARLRAQLRTDARSAVECDFDASLGSLAAAKGKLVLPLGMPAHATAHISAVDLAQVLAIARVKKFEIAEAAQGHLSADVTVSLGSPWRAQIAITKSDAAVKLAQLPWKIEVAGGSVRVDPASVRLEKVAVAMLDAKAQISGRVGVRDSKIELLLEEGVVGEKIVQWALERGGVPARFEPRTPLRFAAQRIAWAPKGAVEAAARIDFDGGPALTLAAAWRPGRLELRRLTIKDARSDAVLGATVAGDLIEASFSGRLQSHSIPAMLRQPLPAASGSAQGELRVTIDRKRPGRTWAEGKLRIEALDLTWLAGRRAIVERADFSTDRTTLRITEARIDVDEQRLDLSGEVRRTEAGPVIDARLESPGVVLERLLPGQGPEQEQASRESNLWPLPVSGRIEVKSGFVQFARHRIAPLEGSVSLEPRRARLEVKEARMCGLSFPLEVTADPEDFAVAAHITMRDEPLESAMRCLTGDTVEITGNADLHAELRTRGRPPNLVRNLTGTARAEMRKGSVKRFALIGNILSFRDLASPAKMKDEGFPYRAITAHGRFENGEFLVDESFFDSDAVRLAAHGRVDLLGANSQLTVLVGLLTTVDRVAGAIPIIGDIFGGSMTALPMSVRGDIRDPSVVPLGPRAISDHLLGIFERTLKLPGKLVPAPAP